MRREVIAVVGENKGIIHARRCREGDRRGGWRELDEKILIAHGGIVFLGYPFEVCWEGEERERERNWGYPHWVQRRYTQAVDGSRI